MWYDTFLVNLIHTFSTFKARYDFQYLGLDINTLIFLHPCLRSSISF